MEPSEEIKNLAEELFVDEKQLINQMEKIINLVKGKIQIYKESGEPLLINSEKYSNREKIFLIILGIFIANQSRVRDSSFLTLTSIGQILGGIPNTTLSAPVKDLVDKKIILRSEREGYELNKLNCSQIISMLEEIDKK